MMLVLAGAVARAVKRRREQDRDARRSSAEPQALCHHGLKIVTHLDKFHRFPNSTTCLMSPTSIALTDVEPAWVDPALGAVAFGVLQNREVGPRRRVVGNLTYQLVPFLACSDVYRLPRRKLRRACCARPVDSDRFATTAAFLLGLCELPRRS